MPELPDVENFRRRFERAALHKTVTAVSVDDERILRGLSPQALGRALHDRRFEETRRHGKHLLVRLDNGKWLTFHFGMTGRFAAFGDGDEEPRFARVSFDFKENGRLAFVDQRLLGEVGLADDPEKFIEEHELGPDALDELREKDFADVVAGRARSLKSLLMDQSRIAGIGNIFSDEILFQAGLHPETQTDNLDPDRRKKLYRTMRNVLKASIDHGAGAEDFEERLPSGFLLPHREKGGHCPQCGTALEAEKISGRTSYFCPKCQPAPG